LKVKKEKGLRMEVTRRRCQRRQVKNSVLVLKRWTGRENEGTRSICYVSVTFAIRFEGRDRMMWDV
jgi:hypothetical protein